MTGKHYVTRRAISGTAFAVPATTEQGRGCSKVPRTQQPAVDTAKLFVSQPHLGECSILSPNIRFNEAGAQHECSDIQAHAKLHEDRET